MVLPVLDHAVRRLAVGEETGAPVRPRRAPLCCGVSCEIAPAGCGASSRTARTLPLSAVTTTARDAFGPDWCSANDTSLHEEMVVAVRLLGVSWPYEALEKVPACRVPPPARAPAPRAHARARSLSLVGPDARVHGARHRACAGSHSASGVCGRGQDPRQRVVQVQGRNYLV